MQAFNKYDTQIYGAEKSFLKYLICYMILFFVPIMVQTILTNIPGLSHINKYNQIIIGIIVNITLIRMAITSKSYIPLVIGCALPSLSALPLGLVGTIQLSFVYTCYMMPFIWLGNLSLVLIFRFLFTNKRMNYALVSFIALVAKTAIIYGFFCVMSYGAGLIPTSIDNFATMQFAMSLYQVITLTVAILSNIAFAIKYRKVENYERL